ncbi:G-protein coupled receptor 54-like [Glandiceps talaboti]
MSDYQTKELSLCEFRSAASLRDSLDSRYRVTDVGTAEGMTTTLLETRDFILNASPELKSFDFNLLNGYREAVQMNDEYSWDYYNGSNCANYSDCYYNDVPPVPPIQIAVAIVFCLIAVVGILGNSAVVVIIFKHRDMRSATNLYILNYAITDLVFLIICAPVMAKLYIDPRWQIEEFFCKFFLYMQYVSLQATCGTLAALTVDRCYVLMNPIRSIVSRTIWRAVVINCSIWLVSLLLHLPVLLFYKVVDHPEFGPGVKFCQHRFPTKTGYPIYNSYLVVMTYLIPLIVISCCYYRILRKVWQPSHEEGVVAQDPKATWRRKKRKKILRMVLIMVSLFAICWGPLHAVNLWFIHAKDRRPLAFVKTFSLCLAYANSCVNPFVYAFAGRHYRTRLFAILRRQQTPPAFHEVVNGNAYSPGNPRRRDMVNAYELSSVDTFSDGHIASRRRIP